MRRAGRIIRNILFYTPIFLSIIVAALAAILVISFYAETKGKSISINVSGEAEGFQGAGYSEPINYADPLLRQRRIILTTDVNPRMSFAVISKLFYLSGNGKPIDIYLRTNGGKISDAFAIADAMKLIQDPVNVHVLGSCQSAGLIILLSATGKRSATPNALFMAHRNLDADEAKKPLTEDYVDLRRLEKLYKAKAKLPEKWLPLTGQEELFFDATDALKYGLIDKIEP